MTPIFFSLAAIVAVESPSLITTERFSVLREAAFSWLVYHRYAREVFAAITLNITKAISHFYGGEVFYLEESMRVLVLIHYGGYGTVR